MARNFIRCSRKRAGVDRNSSHTGNPDFFDLVSQLDQQGIELEEGPHDQSSGHRFVRVRPLEEQGRITISVQSNGGIQHGKIIAKQQQGEILKIIEQLKKKRKWRKFEWV